MARNARAGALVAALATVLLVASGCTSASPVPGVPPTPVPVVTATPSTLRGVWITGQDTRSPDVPYLRIASNGTWTGSDGCNGAQGTWTLKDGGILENTAGPHTLIFCEGEPLPTAFSTAHIAVFTGDQLRLLDDKGETLVTLKRTDRVPTTARGTKEVVGWWGSNDLAAPRQAFLELTDSGRVTGNDGCNTLEGTWKFGSDGAVQFSEFRTTLKGCPGFEPRLSRAVSALVDGDVLVLTDSLGGELGALSRSAIPPTRTPTPTPSAGTR